MGIPGHMNEAFVKAKIVPHGILPIISAFSKTIIWKLFHDRVVNAVQGEALFWTCLYRHGDERAVRVAWSFAACRERNSSLFFDGNEINPIDKTYNSQSARRLTSLGGISLGIVSQNLLERDRCDFFPAS